MKRLLLFVLIALLTGTTAVHAFENSKARIQFHLTRPDLTANCGDLEPGTLSTSDLKLNGIGGPWLLWVLVSHTQGLTGFAFTVMADPGVKILSWQGCGTMEFPVAPWPQSGGANTIVWVDCQRPENGLVSFGYFLLEEGSQGTIRITPHTTMHEIQLSDCELRTDAVPDSCAAAAAVWPDSTSFRRVGLSWRPARERPEPAEPDSVVRAREAEERRLRAMPETLDFESGRQDSATVPAIVDTLKPAEQE